MKIVISRLNNIAAILCTPYVFYFCLFTGYLLAANYTSSQPYKDAKAMAIAPETTIVHPACLTFKYFMKSNLKVLRTDPNQTVTMMDLGVGAGK